MLSKFELSPLGNLLVTLTLLTAVIAGLPSLDFFGRTMDYLHLHGILETASMVCLLTAAAFGFRHRHHPEGGRLVFLAAGLLAVALIDAFHVFSYEDMPDFITPSNPQKAINFWLAGRFWTAVILLSMAFGIFGSRRVDSKTIALLIAANLAFAGLVFWIGIFHESALPTTFVAGRGLTESKIAAEVVIAALFGLAAWRFARMPKPESLGGISYRMLAASAWVFGLAEVYLCMYSDVTDIFNVAGHVYKVIGSMLLAVAAVPISAEKLAQSETLARQLRS